MPTGPRTSRPASTCSSTTRKRGSPTSLQPLHRRCRRRRPPSAARGRGELTGIRRRRLKAAPTTPASPLRGLLRPTSTPTGEGRDRRGASRAATGPGTTTSRPSPSTATTASGCSCSSSRCPRSRPRRRERREQGRGLEAEVITPVHRDAVSNACSSSPRAPPDPRGFWADASFLAARMAKAPKFGAQPEPGLRQRVGLGLR